MKVITRSLNISTQGETDIIDITPDVQRELKNSGLKNGSVVIFVGGSTGGITTCEYEPGLIYDLKEMLSRLVPRRQYKHDQTWGDANGYSHLRSSLLKSSLSVPFSAGKLLLGRWQQVVFIDFDNRPRSRKVILQFLGE